MYSNHDLKIFKYLTIEEKKEILDTLNEEGFKTEFINKMFQNSTLDEPYIFGNVVLVA